jgi:very-short-patch-repair endonuclease
MRREPTPGERRVWEALRQRRCVGLKFRRQAIIGGFIVDFYCPELRLIIEVDGAIHDPQEAQASDRGREQLLAAEGLRVIRIREEEANRTTIQRVLLELTQRSPSPYHGEGDRG